MEKKWKIQNHFYLHFHLLFLDLLIFSWSLFSCSVFRSSWSSWSILRSSWSSCFILRSSWYLCYIFKSSWSSCSVFRSSWSSCSVLILDHLHLPLPRPCYILLPSCNSARDGRRDSSSLYSEGQIFYFLNCLKVY